MRHLRPLLLACSIIAVSAAVSATALACKCMLQSVDQAKAQADAIFEGRVTQIEDVPNPADPQLIQKRVTLAVVRVWKDLENVESVSVTTSDSTASCGFPFEKDTSYLVYAAHGEQGLSTGMCSRTRLIADASEDLANLGGGITPVKIDPAAPAVPEEPKPTVKTGGCAAARGQSQASLWWFGAPVLGLAVRRRRGR
jgi:hypothetical protein